MPKSRPKSSSRDSTEIQRSPVEQVRDVADALYRAAAECCHQHDRIARLHGKPALDDEIKAAQEMCESCHESLGDLVAEYEKTAASVHPTGPDEGWWHKANALWLASREYLRRNTGCETATRQLQEHGPERLGTLHTEFELEASALLAMRQAAAAYRNDRPSAA